MLSRLEKAIYNLYFCYIPIVAIAFFVSVRLTLHTPIKCVLDSSTQDCIFYRFSFQAIYHPLTIINLIFIIYNILYVYYNVVLKQNVVGKSVKRIYSKTKKIYKIENVRKQLSILLFCYFAALILSYIRFPITLSKII